MDSITVSTLSKRYNVSSQTVRSWCDRFGEWLSPNATPPTGAVRTFIDDDLGVLDFVALMRRERIGYEEIEIALSNGERSIVESVGKFEAIEEAGQEFALAMQYESQLAFRDGQIDELRKVEDSLREELLMVREALEVAQKRATRAETLLEQYEQKFEDRSDLVDDNLTKEISAQMETRSKWWMWWKR